MLCNVLMHRALYYTQSNYNKIVLSADRKLFLEMCNSESDHNDMQELADCWKNHITWRLGKGMRVAYGLRAATLQLSLENGDMAGAAARLQRL
jgi:hypothetical protein